MQVHTCMVEKSFAGLQCLSLRWVRRTHASVQTWHARRSTARDRCNLPLTSPLTIERKEKRNMARSQSMQPLRDLKDDFQYATVPDTPIQKIRVPKGGWLQSETRSTGRFCKLCFTLER